jgi:hypothetical protein
MRTESDFRGSRARLWVLLGLLLAAAVVRADAPGDWLAKVPPPPKNLDEALALCGGGSKTYDPAKDPWRRFEPQIQAAIDKNQKDMQAKMGAGDPQAQQDMAAQMMSQMSDPNAMMAYMQSTQVYNQYMQGLAGNAPDSSADRTFAPAFRDGQDAVDTVLKAREAKLGKCPTESGEGGTYPITSCANPIQADADRKKADAANAYLAAVNKVWPQYAAGVKDYLDKTAVLPPGVDANNPQVKVQLAGVPGLQLDGIKKMAGVTQKLCGNAIGLESQSNPRGD